jgi:hypothetical protein
MRVNEGRMVRRGGSAVGVVYVVVTPEQINTINVSPGLINHPANYLLSISQSLSWNLGPGTTKPFPSVFALGNSDFHNLMSFTGKKMPNNILENVCKKCFSMGKAISCEFSYY